MGSNRIRIQYVTPVNPSEVLTSVVHRYNVIDEIASIHRWGCRVVRISTR